MGLFLCLLRYLWYMKKTLKESVRDINKMIIRINPTIIVEGAGDPPELKLTYKDKNKFYDDLYTYFDKDEFNLETEKEKHGFLKDLIYNENIHIHPGAEHWDIAFTHLGKHHNIEFDVEGGYHFSHDYNKPKDYITYPHIIIGGGVKVPLKTQKNKKSNYKL